MTVDATLIVIGKAPNFVATNPAGQYQKGDIFDAVRTSTLGSASPSIKRKFIWVHITDVPATVVRKVKELLEQPDFDPAEPEDDQVLRSRRRWRVLLDDMPANLRNRLRDDRQITVTWTKAKPFLKNHVEDRLIDDTDFA